MTYVPLPIVEVEVKDLRLDLENYRIPSRRDDEAAALKYLFASEDVMGAARMIIRDGYFDNEVPIVFKEGRGANGRYVVLEGNRRVSALKALLDPSIAPGHETEMNALLKRYAVEAERLPRRIRVLVADSRAQAAPRIARLHTGVSKRAWTRDQQANFYFSLLDTDTTVDDVKAAYPDVDVPRFMKMAVMRRFLTGVAFSDHSLRGYARGDDLRMSVFEYAYRNKNIAELIGARFDKDGFLEPRKTSPEKIGKSLSAEQRAAVEYLLSSFRSGGLNTRSPEFKKTTPEHLDLLARLRGDHNTDTTEDRDADGAAESDDLKDNEGADEGSAGPSSDPEGAGASGNSDRPDDGPASGERGPNHPDTKVKLSLSGLSYDKAPVNLHRRYQELRKINIEDLPVATAMLMRSVLEATTKAHFESTAPVTGQLSECMKQVVASYGNTKALQATIRRISSGNADTPGSVQWFNVVTHSGEATPSAADIRSAWSLVNPLLRHLLRAPSTVGT